MYAAIVFLPLLGFLIAGPFGWRIGARPSEIVTTSFLLVVALLSWIVFFQVALGTAPASVSVLGNWFTSGTLKVDWSLKIDSLTAVMLVVVTTVSSLVHLYSIGYMADDPSRPRFFAYLSLFTFAMLMLVTADNLVQLFFGWEGVGLASYLLIGFWYEKPSANAAAIKAFVVNRVGDFGFALGIFLVFVLTGRSSFDQIFAAAPGMPAKTIHIFGLDMDALTITCLLLFMGAMGKSAQFLLHTWLPDAMEGPTPVSALIHAATMVTAGVFMVARLSPLFEQPRARLLRDHHRRDDGVLRRHRSAWCRTTSSGSSPIRPARSLATCSSALASAAIRSASSICSRTPSSRRCCSSAPARSSRDASRAGHAQHGRPAAEDSPSPSR
jgi:NADH-quinone oxidoreductase subunit L